MNTHSPRHDDALRCTAIVLVLAIGVAGAPPAWASAARELLDESARRTGIADWEDRRLDVTIESYTGESVTRVREAQVSERNDAGGGHRTFIEFTSPADVQGTLYLHLKPRASEEQEWIYAPQARRPRRLAPGQSDEVSTGAELGYREVEALTRALSWGDDEAEASLVGQETLDGRSCRVLRIVPHGPQAEEPGYDVWLGAEDLLPDKLVPLGGEGHVPKEIVLSSYETIDGHATPRVVEVVGRDGNWRTVFRLRNVRYDAGLADADFSLSRLNRGH